MTLLGEFCGARKLEHTFTLMGAMLRSEPAPKSAGVKLNKVGDSGRSLFVFEVTLKVNHHEVVTPI